MVVFYFLGFALLYHGEHDFAEGYGDGAVAELALAGPPGFIGADLAQLVEPWLHELIHIVEYALTLVAVVVWLAALLYAQQAVDFGSDEGTGFGEFFYAVVGAGFEEVIIPIVWPVD